MTTNRRRLRRQRLFGSSKSRTSGQRIARQLLGEPLESRMLLAGDLSYHNVLLPSDVDRNGWSSGIDVLIIINELNANGSHSLYATDLKESEYHGESERSPVQRSPALDVDNNGYVTPLDALNAINRINEGEGEGDVMKYVLKVVDAGGNPISNVSVGGNFRLQAWVDDLRTGTAAEGVFAAYLDVYYDPAIAMVSPGKTIVYGDNYQNFKSGELRPGVVDHAGAFTGASFLGPDPLLLWSLDFVATSPGDAYFRGEPTTDPTDPDDVNDPGVFGLDTLILGENIALCPTFNTDAQGQPKCFGSMGFDPPYNPPSQLGLKLTVVRDITAVDDKPPAVNEDSLSNSIDVLSNDILVPLPGAAKQLQDFDIITARGGTVARNDNGTPTNTSDDKLLYTPKANDVGTDTFAYTVANGLGATSKGTVTVEVLALNDRPKNTVPGGQTTNEDQSVVFGSNVISVSDVDADAGGGLRVTLSVSHGKIVTSPSSASVPTNNAKTVAVTGLVADVNTALNGLTYTPDKDFNGTDALQVVTDDLGHTGAGGPLSITSTVTITINAVNDPPENHLPPPQETDEEVPLVLSAANTPDNSLSVSDVDAGNGVVQVALTLGPGSTGVLALSNKNGLTFADQDGDTSTAFSGTLTDVNIALAAGLTYTPAVLFVGSENLTITTTSQGQTDSDVLAIEVIPTVRPRAINDTLTTVEDGSAVTINVLGNDRPNTGAQVTLLSFTQPANGTVTLNDKGTSDQSDDTLSYAPKPNFFGPDPFTYRINDSSGVGADSTATVAVNVQPVNDDPVLTVPGDQVITEDQKPPFAPLFKFSPGSFSVEDIDAGTGNVTVAIATTLGVVDIAANGANVQGSGTANVTILGTLTQVNAALSDVAYRPNDDANGVEVLTVNVNDGGNTGSPGPRTDAGSVTINITPVNDAPENQVPPPQSPFITNFDNILSAATGNAIQVSDVDAGDADLVTTLTATRGILKVINENLVDVVYSNDFSSVTLTGSQDAINRTLAEGLIYRVSVEGPAAITVITTDGEALSNEDRVELDVVDFVPSTVGGSVYFWGDKDRDHAMDANEIGARLAGVKIAFVGTNFRNLHVEKETLTDVNGRYSFSNLEPGTYQIHEIQPYGVLDGEDRFEAPVTAADNDVATVNIGIRGGVDSRNNDFTEVGPEARYLSIWQLLASSHDPRMQSGFVFSLGEDSWYSLRETQNTPPDYRWSGSGFSHVWFELIDGEKGFLHVIETATGKAKQAEVTLSSGRMLPSSDYLAYLRDPLHNSCMVTIIGGPNDFKFVDVPEGEGEGLASATANYQRGVDALFAGYGEGSNFA